ncbi:MAG: EamA family transporter [Clostridia bacterium]|nr:EamA family transporter [Clostridia bacterium]
MKKARVMLIISMAVFGTIGLFVKNINLPSGEIALYRAVLASVLIGLFLLFKGEKVSVKDMKKELLLLLLSGAAMGFNWIFLFEAYKYTTVSVATLSYYFAPVIVTAACPLLFKEKMNLRKWICFLGATAGIVLITLIGEHSENTEHIKGIALGLGAAVLYATVILLNKYIKNVGGIERTFFQFIAAIIVLLPYVLFTEGFNLTTLSLKGWGYLLAIGLIHTGITYCLYFSSLKFISGQKAAILSYIDPLVAVLCSSFILGEEMLPMQIMGGIMILGFTLYNEISN